MDGFLVSNDSDEEEDDDEKLDGDNTVEADPRDVYANLESK